MNRAYKSRSASGGMKSLEEGPWETAIQCLESRVLATEELLDVYEKVVLEQTGKLFGEMSDRKRAEEALIDSERFLSAVIESLPIPMFIIDKDHRVVYWNNALERYSGIGAAEIIGTNQHFRAFYSEERPCIADLLVDENEGDIPAWYGAKFRRSKFVEGAYGCIDFFPKFGRRGAWLYFTAKVIKGANGAIMGAMEALVDITERMLAEQEIRRLNEELTFRIEQLIATQQELVRKEKLASIGLLAGSVGHELRNPLAVMSNAVYFLQTMLPGTDEQTGAYLGIIKKEIGKSQRIITDLLDFSRTREPEPKAVPVHELIRETIKKCAIPENIKLDIVPSETFPSVMADPLQMEQVFLNLITNAVQAMPDGGALRISARRVQGSKDKSIERGTLNVERDSDFVEIRIEDTGMGIAPENMDLLFQPLYTTKARGIGLGLSICRNLAEANGGRIVVESRSMNGTAFTVALPAAEPGSG